MTSPLKCALFTEVIQTRPNTIWLEDTSMPVQTAHNLAALHYAQEGRIKARPAGNGNEFPGGDGGQMAKELSKWTTAHPMASVGSVLMQSVEPLEDFITGVTELIPMPNPVAPSAIEVRSALMRRRKLDRERGQQLYTFQIPEETIQDQLQQRNDEAGQGERSSGSDAATSVARFTPESSTSIQRRGGKLLESDYNRRVNIAASQPTPMTDQASRAPYEFASSATADVNTISELAPEMSPDNRLVLPELESLIALRRSRLTRTISQQPQHQPYPPARPPSTSTNGGGGGTAAGDGAWYGAVAQPNPLKGSFSRTTRRFGTPSSQAPTNTGSSASPLRVQLPEGSSQPPPLSQFPGLWRASRKWEVYVPEALDDSGIAATAATTATVAAGPPEVVPRGASFNGGSSRPVAAVVAASSALSSPSSRTLGIAWSGNDGLSAATVGGGSRSGVFALQTSPTLPSVPQPMASHMSPGAPFSPMMTLTTSAKSLNGISPSVSPPLHFSPRTSMELGLASSVDTGQSGSLSKSMTRQRALLHEWQEWRDRGALGPPPGIDEETDNETESEGGADGGGEDEEDDEDDCGLLLGLGSRRKPNKKEKAPPVAPALTATMTAIAAAGEEEGVEVRYERWRRARQITQSMDMVGLDALSSSAPPARTLTTSPLGSLSSVTSPKAAISTGTAAGMVSAHHSPMASRKRQDGGSSRPHVGPVALPLWLTRAFAQTGADDASASVTTAASAEDTRTGDSIRATTSAAITTAATTTTAAASTARVPLLTSSRHLSFTSKFNRFKQRIASFSTSSSQAAKKGDANPASAAAEPADTSQRELRSRMTGSNDGRIAFGGSSGGGGGGQLAVRKGMAAADVQVRTPGRTSLDISTRGRPQQQQQPGTVAAMVSRQSTRLSLDSKLSLPKARLSTDRAATGFASLMAVAGGGSGHILPEGHLSPSLIDRSPRGDAISMVTPPGLLPPVIYEGRSTRANQPVN